MPELQTLLRHYGDHLEELAPPITAGELLTAPLRPPTLPPWWRHPAFVTSAAVALVIIVVGGISLLISADPDEVVEEPTVTTIVSTTVPTTVAEAAPEPTTPPPPPLLLPPPPALGDTIDLHADHLALAAVIIEAAEGLDAADFEIYFDEDEAGSWRSAEARGPDALATLRAFGGPEEASAYMAARMAEEQATELEQPSPSLGIGDESVVYRQIVPRVGEVDVYLVRVGPVVLEGQHFDPDGLDPDFDTTAMTMLISAIRSPESPSVAAFQPQVEDGSDVDPDRQPVSYMFDAWSLPLPDGEGGDKAEWSMGYERDGQGTCTAWTGGVEPLDYVRYTSTGATVSVVREFFSDDGWATEEIEIAPTDPVYLAAVEGCNRFPALAEGWGLGELVPELVFEFFPVYDVFQAGPEDFVLVTQHVGHGEIEPDVEFEDLGLFELLPGVVVLVDEESNPVRVNGLGHVSISFEFEGQRDALAEVFGIDLSSLPDEVIGVGFELASG
jgi:hypothetical protein